MRTILRDLLIFSTVLLYGCASLPSQNTSQVFIGRAVKKEFVPAMPRSSGAYQPGMGGALGGLVAGILIHAGGTPAYTMYTLESSEGNKQEFPTTDKFRIGDCLAVYTPPTRNKDSFQTLDEVTIKSASGCSESP